MELRLNFTLQIESRSTMSVLSCSLTSLGKINNVWFKIYNILFQISEV